MKLKYISRVGIMALVFVSTVTASCVFLYNNKDIDLYSSDARSSIEIKDVKLLPGKSDITTEYGKEFYSRDMLGLERSIVSSPYYQANMKTENYRSSLLFKEGYYYVLYENYDSSKIEFRNCGVTFGDYGFTNYKFNFPRYSGTLSRYYDNDLNKFCFTQKFKFDDTTKYFYSEKAKIIDMFTKNKSDLYSVEGEQIFIKVFNLDEKKYEEEFKITVSFTETIYYKTIDLFAIDPDQSSHIQL